MGSQTNSLQQEISGIANELNSLKNQNQQLQTRIARLQNNSSCDAIVEDLRN